MNKKTKTLKSVKSEMKVRKKFPISQKITKEYVREKHTTYYD
jgi:hypothetical protein